MRLAGFSIDATHGAESAGSRASQSRPPAISSGPAMRKRRDPYPARQRADPGRQEGQHSPLGRPMRPAPSAV